MSKSSRLASSILTAAGICCLRVSVLAGHPGHSKVAIGGIADRDSTGQHIWFRSQREADRVFKATLSRCFDSKKTKAGLTVKLPPGHVVDLITSIAQSLGITPIHDADVATTFDTISRRAETAIASMGREATFKRLQGAADLDPVGLLARFRG